MRQVYRSVTPAVVRALMVEHLKAAFPWKASRSVSVHQILQCLLLAATGCTSLFHVVRRFFRFSVDSPIGPSTPSVCRARRSPLD